MNRIAVVGAGYVGLVTGTCFAQKNNFVTIIEKDKDKIHSLLAGKVPFYEPGLDQLLKDSIETGRIVFSHSIDQAIQQNPEIIFSCVGTPSLSDGNADLSAVYQVAKTIGKNLNGYSLIINKSTVPVGTGKAVREIILKELENRNLDKKIEFDVASNPEFLKEGDALGDFFMPDRVVIGTDSFKAEKTLKKLYEPFISKDEQFIVMNLESAELTKYASNAMLATRISFINELALLADKVGADVLDVKKGMSTDSRIGSAFLNAGIGYGGSCFPKDVKALVKIGEKYNQPMNLTATVDWINDFQRRYFINKIIGYYGNNLEDKVVGVWGLSFKPETDDIRNSPAIDVLNNLINYGSKILACDPQAEQNISKLFGNKVLFESADSILKKSNFLIILTEWKEFLSYKPADFKLLKDRVVFDGRNCFEPLEMRREGINYFNIGRNKIFSNKEFNNFLKLGSLKQASF